MMKPLILLLYVAVSSFGFSQNRISFNDMLTMLDEGKIEETKTALHAYDFKELSKAEKAKYLLNEGIIKFKEEESVVAYEILLRVKEYKNNTDKMVIYNANDYMMRIANTVSEYSTASASLIEENCAIAEELDDPRLKIQCIYNSSYKEIIGDDFDLALKLNYQMQRIALDNDLEDELLGIENNIGTIHYFKEQYDSTLFYFERNLERCRKTKDTLAIAQRLNNMAMLRSALGDHQLSLAQITEAESLSNDIVDSQFVAMLLRNKADILSNNKDFKNASSYYYKHLAMKDTLDEQNNALQLSELQAKYETAENKRINAELESKNLKSESRIYLLLFLLTVALGIAGYFILNSYKTKKLMAAIKIAQEQKELKLLKDQELASIDAMIAGQEKERIKIASDLHDDLGSSLTTVRMCIENVKETTTDKDAKSILSNAHQILNETYAKVRTISHTQNSRVLSENGWISSIQDLIFKINKSGKIDLEVVHSGLKGSLSNTTELNLFRILQELINNILKHADATQGSITITGYDTMLDIMIEDNGKGFDYEKVDKNGIGLNNISKRINDMNGTFAVDSNVQKGGTTITIEIPLV